MTRVMVVASITLPSGDVPLLVDRALRKLGCATRLVAVDEDQPLLEAARCVNVRNFDRRRFNQRLKREVEAFEPELVLLYGSNWGVFPETLRWLHRRHRCRIVLWEKNLNLWMRFQVECFPYYDHLFCADSHPLPLLEKPATGLRDVRFLGPCCDPEEHGRVELSPRDVERFEAEITFVGGGRRRRRELFESFVRRLGGGRPVGDCVMRNYRGEVDLYLHNFTLGELAALVRRAGLKIIKAVPLNERRNGEARGLFNRIVANGFLIAARKELR